MVAVPEDLILLVVLDEEAIGGDVVAVDDEAVGAEVGSPADAVTVVGAPDPGVVDDGVVGVDFEVDVGAAGTCSADAEEEVMERDGIFGVVGVTAFGTDLEQDGGFGFACVEEDTG